MSNKIENSQGEPKSKEGRIRDLVLFMKVLAAVLEDPEFLPQFDRLTGYNLTGKGPAIILAIDRATGNYESGVHELYELVVKIYQQMEVALASSGASS